MNYTDQKCLGLILLEKRRFKDGLQKRTRHKGNAQKEITNFFKVQPHLSNKENLSQTTNLGCGTKGILLNRAVDIGKSRRPKVQKATKYRQRIHQKIRIILNQHKRRPSKKLSAEEVEKLRHQPMLNLLGPPMSRRQH